MNAAIVTFRDALNCDVNFKDESISFSFEKKAGKWEIKNTYVHKFVLSVLRLYDEAKEAVIKADKPENTDPAEIAHLQDTLEKLQKQKVYQLELLDQTRKALEMMENDEQNIKAQIVLLQTRVEHRILVS